MRGLAGLRVAARCHGLARDPAALRPIVWGAWALCADHGLETYVHSADRIAAAVRSVGSRLFEVPGLAEALANSPLSADRRALVEALPEGPASEGLLCALAADDDAFEVRSAARKKLKDDDPWGGAFPISPEGHADDVLQAARRVLELPSFQLEVDDVADAFAPLQDALAVACWVRVLACSRDRELVREGHRRRVGARRKTAESRPSACILERDGSAG